MADAGVVGEPDRRTPGDERPHAFVVLKPETQLSAVDVTNFVAGRVAAYKHIQNVTFVPEIPKSASGKILRACCGTGSRRALPSSKFKNLGLRGDGGFTPTTSSARRTVLN